MKPDVAVKSVEKPKTAPFLLYTVDGAALDGKPAAICDIRNCRIAIVGIDIATTRTRIKSMNLRVVGSEAEKQDVKSTKGEEFFVSKYDGKKAKCRFHNFEFELTDRLLSYGAVNDLGFRTNGTLWANATNLGVLILVDGKTGNFATHSIEPATEAGFIAEERPVIE